MKRHIDWTPARFLLVGVINTLVGAGTMFILYNVFHCSDWVSSVANYLVGGVVSFFLNKYFTFRQRGWSWGQAAKFAVNVAVCYLIAYGLAKPLAAALLPVKSVSLRDNAAMLSGMCLYTILNYLGQRFYAFKKE